MLSVGSWMRVETSRRQKISCMLLKTQQAEREPEKAMLGATKRMEEKEATKHRASRASGPRLSKEGGG